MINYYPGHMVIESLTDADATAEVITFTTGDLSTGVEVWHGEAAAQTFVINGTTVHIGPGGWRSQVAGAASAEVTIPAGVACVVSRLS